MIYPSSKYYPSKIAYKNNWLPPIKELITHPPIYWQITVLKVTKIVAISCILAKIKVHGKAASKH